MRTQYEPAHPLEPGDLADDPMTQLGGGSRRGGDRGAERERDAPLERRQAGAPQSRYVLLRGLDDRGLRFFTNYRSAKARELDAHPRAALAFGWPERHRQVRVTGRVERLAAAESDAYFASRPRETQIGAWASEQSEVIADRTSSCAGSGRPSDASRAGRSPGRPTGAGTS